MLNPSSTIHLENLVEYDSTREKTLSFKNLLENLMKDGSIREKTFSACCIRQIALEIPSYEEEYVSDFVSFLWDRFQEETNLPTRICWITSLESIIHNLKSIEFARVIFLGLMTDNYDNEERIRVMCILLGNKNISETEKEEVLGWAYSMKKRNLSPNINACLDGIISKFKN